jgi:hypothetical protein
VPVLSILVLRRWDLLKKLSFWLAPVPVVLTALPWTLMTMQITKEGMLDQSVSSYLPEAFQFYVEASWQSFGFIILIGAAAGVGRWVFSSIRRGAASPFAVSMLSFAVALVALYLVSPTGFAARYLLPVAPLLLIATPKGLFFHFFQHDINRSWLAITGVSLSISMALLNDGPSGKKKIASGFSSIADELLHRDAGGKVLVVSDARGEGSLTAELAFRLSDRVNSPWTIVRGSKFLAKSDWIGRGYATAFANADEFKAAAQKAGIAWVVADTGVPEAYLMEHHKQIAAWTEGWKPEFEARSEKQWAKGSHPVKLFHLAPATKP